MSVLRRNWSTRQAENDEAQRHGDTVSSSEGAESPTTTSLRPTGAGVTQLDPRDRDRLAVFSGLFSAHELPGAGAGSRRKFIRTELPHFTPAMTLGPKHDQGATATIEEGAVLAAVRPTAPGFRVPQSIHESRGPGWRSPERKDSSTPPIDVTTSAGHGGTFGDAVSAARGSVTSGPASGSRDELDAGTAVGTQRSKDLLDALDARSPSRRGLSDSKSGRRDRPSRKGPGAAMHDRIKRALAEGKVLPPSGRRHRHRSKRNRGSKADFNSATGEMLADGLL